MAVQKNNGGESMQDQLKGVADQMQSNNNPQFQAGAAAQTAQQTTGFDGISDIFDLDNTNSLLGGSTGDMVAKLMEKTEADIKIMEQRHKVVKFGVLPVDREANQVHASAVILSAIDAEYPRLGILAHVMILEGTSPQEDPINVTIQGHAGQPTRTISVPVMTSAVWDDDYHETVNKVINEANGFDPSNQPTIAGVTVIPRNFDLEDKEAFAKMIRNVSHSLVTEIAKSRMTGKLVLSKPSDDKYIAANVSYSNRHVKDSVGLPQRSDVVITLNENTKRANANRQSLNGKLRAKRELGTLTGFVDFFWNPTAPVQQGGMFGQFGQQQMPTQKYTPAFIIRSLKTPVAGVIEAQLLMLLSAGAVGKQNEWVNSLVSNWSESRREENKNRMNFRDVGALNIEGNLPLGGQQSTSKYGAPVNTIEDSFTQESFMQYLGAIVRPELQWALDMPILGAESWYMDRFLDSAKHNKPSTQVIYNALNDMTNGHFEGFFQKLGGGDLWLGDAVPYHTGYYYGERDELRDLADIDLLAVMNRLGVSDPSVGERWARTWVPSKDNSEVLLDERLSIITDVLGGKNYVLTGWGARSFLNPNVIVALGHAAAENGFEASLVTPYANNVNLQQRATFDFNGVSGARSSSFDGVFQGRGNAQGFDQNFGQFGGFSSRFQ